MTANKEQAASGGEWKLVPVEPTTQMIEEGAQRLVQWEDGCTWPDSWDALQVLAARNEAERVWRSMWLAASPPPTASAAQQDEAVGHVWFHRGLPNFDDSDALRALDDGKGTPIPLYLHPAPQQGERVAELEKEVEEYDQLNQRLSALLTGTANALKGPPKLLHSHGWDDLPTLAAKVREDWRSRNGEVNELRAENGRLTRERDEARRELAEVRRKADICGSCGKTALLPCPRPADHPCLREHNGGTRSALATSSKGGGA